MRVGPGSPWPGPFKKAATANNILEAAEEYQLRRRLGVGGAQKARPLPPDLVKVKNGTGTLLRAGEVVELDGLSLDDVTRGFPWFDADIPDETRPFAILLEGIADSASAIGLAQISGCCPALINVQATTDRWAQVISGQDTLQGHRFCGQVRLLHTPGGTGEQLMWVMFQNCPGRWIGKADSAINGGGNSGTISIWEGAPGSESDTTFNLTAYNRTDGDIGSGDWCEVVLAHRELYVVPWQCEEPA